MTTVDLPLLPLGRGVDLRLRARRGVPRRPALAVGPGPGRAARLAAKDALGDRVFVLGHHYQRDEVIQFADVTGDSFKLAREAAARPEAEFIVFCGVHFMAESADILTSPDQKVILPDLAAGCSMADMARLTQVEDAWDALVEAGIADDGRAGDLHELQRRHQGVLRPQRRRRLHLVATPRPPWSGPSPEAGAAGAKVLFFPDQHLGRNTAVLKMGHVPGRLRGLGPAPPQRRAHRRAAPATPG